MDKQLIDYAAYLEWSPEQLRVALCYLTKDCFSDQTTVIFVPDWDYEYLRDGMTYDVELVGHSHRDGAVIIMDYSPRFDVLFLKDER